MRARLVVFRLTFDCAIKALACSVEPLVASTCEKLAALPQCYRFFEPALVALKGLHD